MVKKIFLLTVLVLSASSWSMDFMTSMEISASGLKAQRKRMATISSNIANAQTVRTAEGGPYRKKIAVFGSEPTRDRAADILDGTWDEHGESVHVTEIISDNKPPILKYEPNHPDANADGYVAYPNINVMTEMADMISASRSFESNIKAFNTTKQMAQRALEIGR